MAGSGIPVVAAGRKLKTNMKCVHCGHDIPEGRGVCIYCGAVDGGLDRSTSDQDALKDHVAEGIADGIEIRDYMAGELTQLKSRRRNPVSKAVQACIFFVSMLLGGLLVWLFK